MSKIRDIRRWITNMCRWFRWRKFFVDKFFVWSYTGSLAGFSRLLKEQRDFFRSDKTHTMWTTKEKQLRKLDTIIELLDRAAEDKEVNRGTDIVEHYEKLYNIDRNETFNKRLYKEELGKEELLKEEVLIHNLNMRRHRANRRTEEDEWELLMRLIKKHMRGYWD